jgi:hypothetical protein
MTKVYDLTTKIIKNGSETVIEVPSIEEGKNNLARLFYENFLRGNVRTVSETELTLKTGETYLLVLPKT